MTVTGAVLIAAVLGPMMWLILRGGRATGRAAPQDHDGSAFHGELVNASASRTIPTTQTTPEDVCSG